MGLQEVTGGNIWLHREPTGYRGLPRVTES